MDYSFWRKNDVENFEDDHDPHLWLIWCFWKAQNDRFLSEIDINPHELVRYAEGECRSWCEANKPSDAQQETHHIQIVSSQNICTVDGLAS